MNLDQYDIKTATNKLLCTHSYNANSRYHYEMPCIVLKHMPRQRLKVVVFGDRFHKNTEHIKRIRYVNRNMVTGELPQHKEIDCE